MGFFRKEYTLEGAIEKLKKDDKNKFTAIPINPDAEDTKYWVLHKNSLEVRKKIEAHKTGKISNSQENIEIKINNEYKNNKYANKRQEFTNNVSGDGKYQDIAYQKPKDYNNYQETKGYKKSIGYNR